MKPCSTAGTVPSTVQSPPHSMLITSIWAGCCQYCSYIRNADEESKVTVSNLPRSHSSAVGLLTHVTQWLRLFSWETSPNSNRGIRNEESQRRRDSQFFEVLRFMWGRAILFSRNVWCPHLDRCFHQLLWENYLCEIKLRTRVRNKAAHSGIHVGWEPSPIPETHPSAVVGRGVQTACHCKEEFL